MTYNKLTTRNSSFELIRIVAMIFIVIYHILYHGFNQELPYNTIVIAFLIGGVDLFLLITGYWGIKFRWKSLINLFCIVIFYALLSQICSILIFQEDISIKGLLTLFFPASKPQYWFISCYIFLYLLSPLLSNGLKNMSNKQLLMFVGILTYINCVSGWIFRNAINGYGYNTMHFIFMYVLGHTISHFNLQLKLKKYYWLLIYIITCVSLPIICSSFPTRMFSYNNPIIILSAIALFCFIIRHNFKNHTVNYIASCVLPVYILQDGMIGQKIYKFQGLFYEQYSSHLWIVLGFIGICTLLLFVAALLIEPLRRKITDPIIDWISTFIQAKNLDLFAEKKD